MERRLLTREQILDHLMAADCEQAAKAREELLATFIAVLDSQGAPPTPTIDAALAILE